MRARHLLALFTVSGLLYWGGFPVSVQAANNQVSKSTDQGIQIEDSHQPPGPATSNLALQPPTASTASPAKNADANVQVLTRGPVHEAFAEPVNFNAVPGLVIHKAPPAAIKEIPPNEKPAGDNVQWISGYWGWDPKKSDFIWVSGVWRIPPPDRHWVAGNWAQVQGGYQWVSGYWAPNDQQTAQQYLPEPPKSLESGPSSPSPGDDYVWIPGHWQYQSQDYAWSPGYWSQGQADSTWVPDYYNWTPNGYLPAGGYWDYPLDARGMLFAPVSYDYPYYNDPGYYYTPSYVIGNDFLYNNLFCYPDYNHYCFGDFYSPFYTNFGILPCFQFAGLGFGFSDIFAHRCFEHRHDFDDFMHHQHGDFDHKRSDPSARPFHDLAQQNAHSHGGQNGGDMARAGARSLHDTLASGDFNRRFSQRTQASMASAQHGNELARTASMNAHLSTQAGFRGNTAANMGVHQGFGGTNQNFAQHSNQFNRGFSNQNGIQGNRFSNPNGIQGNRTYTSQIHTRGFPQTGFYRQQNYNSHFGNFSNTTHGFSSMRSPSSFRSFNNSSHMNMSPRFNSGSFHNFQGGSSFHGSFSGGSSYHPSMSSFHSGGGGGYVGGRMR